MKKTALNRRTPMKRTAKPPSVRSALGAGRPLKRGGKLRPKSKKRQREDREVNDLAKFSSIFVGWSDWHPQSQCWLCREAMATEIHHISGRASKLRHHRCNLSAVCGDCHRDIVPVIGVPGMFAFKRLRDPDGFDAAVMRALLRAKGQGNGRAPLGGAA